MRRLLASLVVVVIAIASGRDTGAQNGAPGVPNRKDSLKFAAIGDNGTGDQAQYDVAAVMQQWHSKFPF